MSVVGSKRDNEEFCEQKLVHVAAISGSVMNAASVEESWLLEASLSVLDAPNVTIPPPSTLKLGLCHPYHP